MSKTLVDSIRESFWTDTVLFGDDFLRSLCTILDKYFDVIDCQAEGEKIISEKYFNGVKQNDLYQ